jgi:hypothetical protein
MIRVVLLLVLLPLTARADPRWDRYQVLMWQDRTPAQMQGLAALGFTGVRLGATGGAVDAEGKVVRQKLGLPYYLENIATDFYAPYHRFAVGKPVNWLFEAGKARRLADPSDLSVFERQPGLIDPIWLDRIRTRLARVVRDEAAGQPLFYNLGDESGIGDLAAAWDFDRAPESLSRFRAWLHTQYADLNALNLQWGAAYRVWDEVMPELTDAALRRTDGNYSAWSDFKAWMDIAFADAVQTGTAAVHEADPSALSALEGGQTPGWGGYDYTRLAPSVDVMEIYDYGNALDLATAFNPTLIPLRTSFGAGPRETHAVWRSLLHGGRGMVVWDEANDVVGADGKAGPRGLEIAATVRAVAPIASLLNQAQPAPDPVAVLYNQESFRLRWLLDRQAGSRDWAARDAEREYDDNAWRASRRVMLQRLAEIGVQPRLVSSAMIEGGGLADGSVRVLMLPHAIALSDAAVAAIAAFRTAGGLVLADTEPGLFDGHGRRRAAPPLPGVAQPQAVRPDGEETSPALLAGLTEVLNGGGAPPRLRLLGPDRQPATGVEVRWFRHPRGMIVALQAGRPWGSPPGVVLRLPARALVSDLRKGGEPVLSDRIEVALDGVEPTVLLLMSPP